MSASTPKFDASAFFDSLVSRCQAVPLSGTEFLPIAHALGRVAKHDVFGSECWPRTALSTATGYAIRAADAINACEGAPAWFKPAEFSVNSEGHESELLAEGAYAYILRGLSLPISADAVLSHDSPLLGRSRIYDKPALQPVPKNLNVFPACSDLLSGQKVLDAGTRITPGVQAALVMAGISKVEVARAVRIAIVSISPLMRPVGEPLQPWQMPDANSLLCQSLFRNWGYQTETCRFETDTFADPMAHARLQAVLRDMLLVYDLIVLTGGLLSQPVTHTRFYVPRAMCLGSKGRIKPPTPKPAPLLAIEIAGC